MKRLIWNYLLLFTIALFAFLFIACAGNQAGAYGEEELYPGEQMPDDTSSEEDEVLRLLGIKDEEVEPEPTTPAPDDDEQVFQDEIERLENQVAEKDREMEEYKKQLAEKDAQIQSKSQTLAQMRTSYSVPTGASFKSQYDNGLRLYNSRRYNEAIAVFDQLLATRESNSLIDNCQYWKGECYYGLGNYGQAILEFQKVFQFPNSNKFDDAQLKLGLCYMRLNNLEQARKEFDKLLREYPTSEYANKAQSYLMQL